ncbi:hypothetical protein NEOLEDRAFT_919289 [Neolentinus lepideus HHB14362 ss-1]|uniref:Uncharacterized protein n=1 Tax=Neolentinus lepideus HHB14362 ss-1 TaxID=1314782 RepID=A0A165UMJ2_9AGAM|nr:hypothetical protein NEOLEDRAFT_919289 [Neolentinus lepideus HHB14362 ss-1]
MQSGSSAHISEQGRSYRRQSALLQYVLCGYYYKVTAVVAGVISICLHFIVYATLDLEFALTNILAFDASVCSEK